jgi:hypothetical protein
MIIRPIIVLNPIDLTDTRRDQLEKNQLGDAGREDHLPLASARGKTRDKVREKQ